MLTSTVSGGRTVSLGRGIPFNINNPLKYKNTFAIGFRGKADCKSVFRFWVRVNDTLKAWFKQKATGRLNTVSDGLKCNGCRYRVP
ncbi:hypothetical protein E4T99_06690 [Neisseria sp. WF04]|nr:hypothetical protein E4T99_06690 [Neisseria sp. WF04]